jgi:hypothetical protein
MVSARHETAASQKRQAAAPPTQWARTHALGLESITSRWLTSAPESLHELPGIHARGNGDGRVMLRP